MERLGRWWRIIGTGTGGWARHVLAVGLGLCALALVTGSLGNLSPALNGLLAASGLLALALLSASDWRRTSSLRLALALGIMAASLLLVARGEPLGLLGAALFFFALSLLASPEDGAPDAPTAANLLPANVPAAGLLLTALLFALYRLLVAYVPVLWHAEQWLALHFSWFVGVGLMLGPTALGLPLFFLFFFYTLATFLLASAPAARARIVFVLWALALVLALVGYIWLQPPLGSLLLTYWPEPVTPSLEAPALPSLTYLESLPLLFLLLWLVSALAALWLRPGRLPLVASLSARRWAAAGCLLLALGAALLALDLPLRANRSNLPDRGNLPTRGGVLFYDVGQLEWGRPTFGQYGPHSGGTYGLWPDYLAAYGYQALAGPLSEENVAAARAVFLINLPQRLSAEEQDRLLAFVRDGGALVIWGEHTGLDRIREPINDLLARLPGRPLRLKFDSAVPVRQGWTEGLAFLPHPALYGIRDPVNLVIAVGASLDIRPPARPVIVGRFGHSDAGNVADRSRNYAGDMRYNPGERLGDLVLAAEVDYGQGRIVLLGDTTPLGSVNLMTSMPFQVQLLDWATAPSPGWLGGILGGGWFALLLLAGGSVCLWLGRSRLALAGAAVVLALALALAGWFNSAALPVPAGPIAYVDASHQERFDRLLWEETSVGGLDYNLVRNGLVPLLLHRLDLDALQEADLLVVIAPGGRFSAREVQRIARWVEGGGRLLLSVGYEESEGSQDLLAAFGLSVGNVPLGPAEVGRSAGLVRFHEAWPALASSGEVAAGEVRTIVEGYGYPLVVYRSFGQGGVALIADSAFLLGSNLEGQYNHQEGNVLLLRELLRDHLQVGGEP